MLMEMFKNLFGERVVSSPNRRISVKKNDGEVVITITSPSGKLVSEVEVPTSDITNFPIYREISPFELTVTQKKAKKALTLIQELEQIPIGISE